MLDKITVTGPVLPRMPDHLLHRVPLVIPGKDPRRGMRTLLRALLRGGLDMHVALQNIQPVVPGPDLLPKIRNTIIIIPNGPWVPRRAADKVVSAVPGGL